MLCVQLDRRLQLLLLFSSLLQNCSRATRKVSYVVVITLDFSKAFDTVLTLVYGGNTKHDLDRSQELR